MIKTGVSIIMPTYRQDKMLIKAIKSVINQSYHEVELIIVDDNKDETYSVECRNIINKINDSRIVYIKNSSNLGSAKSRNVGINISKYEYITFLDDDDEYVQNKILKQLEFMINLDLDFSSCGLTLVEQNQKMTERMKKFTLKNEPLLNLHLKYHITGTSTLMFKSQFLKNINGFDNYDLGDEFYLVLKAINSSGRYGHLMFNGVMANVHIDSGLSRPDNKLVSEKHLFLHKKNFFNKLSINDISYIYMRHYLVMAYTYKRSRNYLRMLFYVLKSIICNPFGAVRVALGKDL